MISLTPIRLTVRSLGIVVALACVVPLGSGCRRLRLRMPKRKPTAVLLGPREIVPPPFRAPTASVRMSGGMSGGPSPLMIPATVSPTVIELPTPVVRPVDPVVVPVEPTLVLPPPIKSKPLTYTLKKGDTLWGIALMYGVTQQEMAVQNNINPGAEKKLKPGTVLEIPPGGRFIPPEKRPKIKPKASTPRKTIKTTVTSSSSGTATVARQAFPADGKYIVKSGDSLWVIARRFGLKSAAIREANSLKTDVLQPGQVLVLPKPQGGTVLVPVTVPKKTSSGGAVFPPKKTVTPSGSQSKVLLPPVKESVVETIKVPTTVPALDRSFPKTLEHTVSKDETLESIADMYDTKVQEVKAANPTIKSDADLRENMKILVPYH